MTEEQLHQFRCRTCEHAQITTTEYEDYKDVRIFCKAIQREISMLSLEQPHEFLLVGCASHSGAGIKPVLDEIQRRVIAEVLPSNAGAVLGKQKMLDIIKEIRQQHEGERK